MAANLGCGPERGCGLNLMAVLLGLVMGFSVSFYVYVLPPTLVGHRNHDLTPQKGCIYIVESCIIFQCRLILFWLWFLLW